MDFPYRANLGPKWVWECENDGVWGQESARRWWWCNQNYLNTKHVMQFWNHYTHKNTIVGERMWYCENINVRPRECKTKRLWERNNMRVKGFDTVSVIYETTSRPRRNIVLEPYIKRNIMVGEKIQKCKS